MSKNFNLYTDVDSLFDHRRGIISQLFVKDFKGTPEEKKTEGDRLWNLYADKAYKERTIELFNYNALGVSNDDYIEAFNNRENISWDFYYPSNLTKRLIGIVFDQEQFVGRPIEISSVTLSVNIYPYGKHWDDEVKETLRSTVQSVLKGIVRVVLVEIEEHDLTASYYRSFDYVFKYNLMINRENHFFGTISKTPTPNTGYVVPNVFVNPPKDIVGEPDTILLGVAAVLSPGMKLIPCKHDVYDYAV